MKLALTAVMGLVILAAVAPAQTFTEFSWTETAQASNGSVYTFSGLLTGLLLQQNVEDTYDIVGISATWSGTPDGTIPFTRVLTDPDYFGSLNYPPSGSSIPATTPPFIDTLTPNGGSLNLNGPIGSYVEPFGSGTLTVLSSNLVEQAPWEPSDTVILLGAATFGLQQYRRRRRLSVPK